MTQVRSLTVKRVPIKLMADIKIGALEANTTEREYVIEILRRHFAKRVDRSILPSGTRSIRHG